MPGRSVRHERDEEYEKDDEERGDVDLADILQATLADSFVFASAGRRTSDVSSPRTVSILPDNPENNRGSCLCNLRASTQLDTGWARADEKFVQVQGKNQDGWCPGVVFRPRAIRWATQGPPLFLDVL